MMTIFLWFIMGFISIGFLSLFLLRIFFQQQQKATYHCVGPNAIELLEPVTIGGIEQWLHVRGRNKDNPILLFLHGGPGSPHIGWFDDIQRPWEDHFTVVQWDQRQAGKSYVPLSKVGNTMRNQTMIEDTKEPFPI